MSTPSLFVGVVTHRNSRYPDSQSEVGLARSLGRELESSASQTKLELREIRINVDNLYQGSTTDLSERESVRAELGVEREWAKYLGRPDGLASWVTRQQRMVRYLTRNSKHWSATNVTRLLNIELSHRNLWQAGLDSGADWILILEDDAYCADASDLAEGLTALVSETGAEKRVTFVNLSASFTPKELGVSHLLKVSADLHWKGSDLRAVFTCARPVTNTVCALLYSRDYLQSLVSVWDSLPMSPVLPIDWKMNKAIMHMQVEPINDMGEALWIEPAPILQRSMHSVER